MDGLKNINWWDHLVSLIVVIAGISIAFYLEGWQADRQASKAEKQFLLALDENLSADQNLLDTLAFFNQQVQSVLVEFSRGNSSTPPDSLIFKIYRLFYLNPFVPQKSVYESIKAAGVIQSLADFKFQSQITGLYESTYDGAKQYDELLEKFITDFYRPYVIDELVWRNGRPLRSFLDDERFKRIVIPLQNMHFGKIQYYQGIKSQVDSTRAMINNYLQD